MNYVGVSFVQENTKDKITCNKILKGASRWGNTEYYICTITNEEIVIEDYIIPTNLIHKMVLFKEIEVLNA